MAQECGGGLRPLRHGPSTSSQRSNMSIVAPGQRLAPGQQVQTFRYWRLCAWSGPVFLFVFVVFWGIFGGNIPPIPANHAAQDLANHYRGDANLIRIGMGLAMTFV